MVTLLNKKKTSLMKYCCRLAEKGLGLTSPNPIVGAVITNVDGDVVATGYHRQYGGPHAEINAIKDARQKGITDFSDLILFVSLEPCNHYGKQPPCTEEIINAGFKNVYIGIEDPNPLVMGKGVARLREAGINVKINTAQKECYKILADYIHYNINKMPYITLKVAQSIDGFISTNEPKLTYLTSLTSRKKVHFIRSYSAVLVGINTILIDNPILDCRLLEDEYDKKKSPKIIILDSKLQTPPNSKIFSVGKKRQIFIAYSEKLDTNIPEIKKRKELLEKQNVILVKSPTKNRKIDLHKLLSFLALEHKIMHILVEGGGKIFSSFINANLFNRLIIFTAPILIGDGIKAFPDVDKDRFNAILNEYEKKYNISDNDLISVFTKKNKS